MNGEVHRSDCGEQRNHGEQSTTSTNWKKRITVQQLPMRIRWSS